MQLTRDDVQQHLCQTLHLVCHVLNTGMLYALQREWIEQQQKAQTVQEVTWPEHIYENFYIVVSTALSP